MDKYVSWSTWSILDLYYIMNMYVDPYQLICRMYTHKNYSCARNQIWTGDTRIFSPLLYQLSYPDHSGCIALLEDWGLCQLKKPKKSYKILPRPWSFLDLQKEDFVSVRVMIWTVNYLIMEIPCLYMFICKYIVSIDLW